MKKHVNKMKSNNTGFTLLEVLIAMVIFTIVCVPLLRSFATSAQTNAKAKLQAKCTTASENIMEDIRNMTSEELLNTYSGCTAFVNNTASGDIHFEIEDNALMNADLPTGYKAVVDLNANTTPSGGYAYPNANSLNVADFTPISVRDCAVYTMPEEYDFQAYQWFGNNQKPDSDKYQSTFRTPLFAEDGTQIGEVPLSSDADKFFRKNLTRNIIINIEDTGIDYTDDEGNVKDAVKVKLKIQYYCNEAGLMKNGKREYVASDIYLFDNTATKRNLNGIYLFYYPRYEAANVGGALKRDIIQIKNPSNYDTCVYVIAMNYNDESNYKEDPLGKSAYLNNKRLKMLVEEGAMTGGKGALELRTNLLKVDNSFAGVDLRTPYSKFDTSSSYGMAFEIDYTAGASTISDDTAIKPLSISDIDGKNLNTDETDTRIYKVTVSVVDPEGVEYSRMEGTKLVY